MRVCLCWRIGIVLVWIMIVCCRFGVLMLKWYGCDWMGSVMMNVLSVCGVFIWLVLWLVFVVVMCSCGSWCCCLVVCWGGMWCCVSFV